MGTPRSVVLASILLVCASAGTISAQSERPVEDRVDVIERVVLVELRLGSSTLPQELFVQEGGAEREVVGIDPVAPGDWHVALYVDWSRTPAPMIWRGALALAREADTLTRLGPVRLLDGSDATAADDPALVDPELLVERLARVAGRAAEMSASLPARDPEGDRAADADLLAATRSRCPGVPCLLVLVSDGYSAATAASGGADPDSVGRSLSAAGWTVLALPLVEHDPDQPAVPDSTGQRTGGLLDLVPVFRIWPWKADETRGAGQPLSTLDALTEPRWAPLRSWADLTGGWIVRHETELPELLDLLSWRRLLVYRSPVGTPGQAGAAVTLQVQDGQGRTVRAPKWVEPVGRVAAEGGPESR